MVKGYVTMRMHHGTEGREISIKYPQPAPIMRQVLEYLPWMYPPQLP